MKSALDKFYTKPEVADLCLRTIKDTKNIDLWLEPSAGAGAFYTRLPTPKLGMDISPDIDEIVEQDFFTYSCKDKKIAVIGNPPFGKNASLAIRFFNHAATFAEVIAFIVPKTFRKISVQNRLDLGWVLQLEQELPKDSFHLFDDNGNVKNYAVPCVWQIWVKGKRNKIKLPTDHKDWQWVDKKSANYAIRRVGGLAGKCFTSFADYSESSNYFITCSTSVYEKLDSLFIELQEVAANTVGNPSLSKTELVYLYSKLI